MVWVIPLRVLFSESLFVSPISLFADNLLYVNRNEPPSVITNRRQDAGTGFAPSCSPIDQDSWMIVRSQRQDPKRVPVHPKAADVVESRARPAKAEVGAERLPKQMLRCDEKLRNAIMVNIHLNTFELSFFNGGIGRIRELIR